MSYRNRLSRDLQRWQDIGLIDAAQHARIAAEVRAAPGTSYLQAVLVLCAVILAATAVVAFVAANWSGMAPASRMAALFLADAVVLAGAYAAARRKGAHPSTSTRVFADGAATLSVAVAAATLALVAQTFHLPPDTLGFLQTIAMLGLVTALVARSGGAALVASVALVLADTRLLDSDTLATAGSPWPFWVVGLGLFLGCLSSWLPAKASVLLTLLIGVANHTGAVSAGDYSFALRPERILTIAVLAVSIGSILAGMPAHRWSARFRDGGEALGQAAAGLCLLGILSVSAWTIGWSGQAPPAFLTPVLAVVVSVVVIAIMWRQRRAATPAAGLLVIGAAALSLAALLAGSDPTIGPTLARPWHSPAHLPPFWTVWGGVVPFLMLVVAGHIEERRALFGWALAAVAGLTIAMLFDSPNLLGFSLNLLGTALLVCLTIALCRWADRRLVARPA